MYTSAQARRRALSHRAAARRRRHGCRSTVRSTRSCNRPVAIKFLSDDSADADARRRFQREAQTASSLNHPHILTVHDAGNSTVASTLSLSLSTVARSKTGRQARSARGDRSSSSWSAWPTGWPPRMQLASCTATSSPHNILVSKNGYAKLADFGLAKLFEVTTGGATRAAMAGPTRRGVIVGTIAYMSPEQATGGPVDARSDIFSFGVVLYELLAGHQPFAGAT